MALSALLALADRQPLTVPADLPVQAAIARLQAAKADYLLAIAPDQTILGILTAAAALAWQATDAPLADAISPCPQHSLDLPAWPGLLALYRQQRARHLLLFDADQQFYGVLSRDRLLDDGPALEAAAEQQRHFRQLAEQSEGVFWVFELATQRLRYISPAYETVWSRARQPLYDDANLFFQTLHPSDRDRVEQARRAAAREPRFDLEYRIIRPDSSLRWIRDRSFPIHAESGAIDCVAGIAEDITERKRIERMKDEFISVVSHELRTPMTSVHGALKLLGTGRLGILSPQGKNMLAIATRNSERLKNLIDDILSLERLQGNQLAVNQRRCLAPDLVAAALELVQPLAQQTRIAIDTAGVGEVAVWADRELLVQVAVNLLSNALKFSPPDATVTVTATQEGEEVWLAVSDRGSGIPADQLEAIFERFYQIDPSDSRQRGGSGLGLTICRQIVSLHQGRIWAESEPGVGSRLTVALASPPATSATADNLR